MTSPLPIIPVSSAHHRAIDELVTLMQSDQHGLSMTQVEQRQQQFGPNKLPDSKSTPAYIIFLKQFLDPLIYILLFAGLVSLSIGNFADAGFIMAVLLLNAVIGTVQEHSAQSSASALNKMVTTSTRVLRGGETYQINAHELTPGDIVLLESGDKVPADLRLFTSHDFHVDESLLSGESLPVLKQADHILAEDTIIAERSNMSYSGSLVVRGRATGMVTAIGQQTELGKIAGDVLKQKRHKPPLLQRMERFTFRMAISMTVVIVLFSIFSFLQGNPLTEVFFIAVALAVAAIPEGLPVAMTVALSISMRRMAKHNVIARRLVTVEALGSCTFIAADKTGTLTQNKISVQKIVLPDKKIIDIQDSEVLKTVTDDTAYQLLARALILPNEGFIAHRNNSWVSHGDAVDTALLRMTSQHNMLREDVLLEQPLVHLIPFESAHRYCASIHNSENRQIVYAKGAVESLLAMCSSMQKDDQTIALDKEHILQQAHELAQEGYRVIGAITKTLPDTGRIDLNDTDLTDMTFLGMVGMIDPLRPESKEAIAKCHSAGIDVAMVTGDHPITAYAIGKELGFVTDRSQVVTSQEFLATQDNPQQRRKLLASTRVFARMEPHQKLSIVEALQNEGEFVAVTGDGANDAPALRAAHVGVAMGKSGTDVARETADMILLDDNFSSIVAGIEQGRIAYANVRKVIHLLISTGAAEIVLFSLSLLFALPLPLTAVQLLWLNLVTNGIQDIALAFEPGEGNELNKPPRAPNEPIFNRIMIERVLMAALVMGSLACYIFYNLLEAGYSIEQARNGTLLLMVLFENVHVFNSRSESRSVFRLNLLSNPLLLFGTLTAQGIHILAMYTPILSDILEITPVTLDQWLHLLSVAMMLLVASEVFKWIWAMRVRHQVQV